LQPQRQQQAAEHGKKTQSADVKVQHVLQVSVSTESVVMGPGEHICCREVCIVQTCEGQGNQGIPDIEK
jgi:hypothetical protein